MSEYGGCIVCGQTLNKGETLLCHDCVQDGYMKQTGAKARYIQLTNDGPVDVTEQVEGWENDSYIRWHGEDEC